jgi:biopolymer transport protein ExbD
MARKGKRETLNFELTPLIDVVFLLLIFFLVSSVFKKEELALLLNLPKASKGQKDKVAKKSITIELNKDKIAYNGKKILIAELDTVLAKVSNKKIVNLRVDGKVIYKRLVKVLDLLQKYKLENVSLITDKDSQ